MPTSTRYAFRLLTTMESIPQDVQDPGKGRLLPASAWCLTNDFIDGDIAVDTAEDGTREVTISTAAFVNADVDRPRNAQEPPPPRR